MYKFLVVLLAFSNLYGQPSDSSKKHISKQTLNLSQSNNEFAFDLYQNLEKDKNIFFSPYSISSALAMVYDGAREETRKEMGKVLHFDSGMTTNESFFMLNRIMIEDDLKAEFRLNILNALWIQTGLHVLPQFLDEMSRYFKTSVRQVDFQKHPLAARREINFFVKDKTMGKIEELLGPDAITNSTKMLLISTIYMKAKWKHVFDPHASEMQPFYLKEGDVISSLMMHQKTFFPYFQAEHFAAVELPYVLPKDGSPDFRFVVILPNERFGLNQLESKMSEEVFNNLLLSLESEEVDLFLPKFRFVKNLNLKETLTQMGMGKAFGPEANFEGINGLKNLMLGQVLHKAFISVDETGTEAAAATAVTMNTKAFLPIKEPVKFVADHPFMFIIYEKSSSQILFIGRISNPA